MLIDLLIRALIELPLCLLDWPRDNTCPKCSNRLKYVEGSGGKRVQCVMCDRVWQREGKTLRLIDAKHT